MHLMYSVMAFFLLLNWKNWIETLVLKELFYFWTYATLGNGDNAYQSEPYWATDQMVQQFIDHYKNYFYNGWKVKVN